MDGEFVRQLCASWEVPLKLERIDVPEIAEKQGRGIEETARDLRRSFLIRVAEEAGCEVIALGHHRDDQAETILYRILRGTGPTGLAAMRLRRGRFIRPLLPFSRRQILEYLQRNGIVFVEDMSNQDCRFSRNRIRHQLLPLLREFNPAGEEQLGRLAEFFAADEDFWRAEEERLLPSVAEPVEGGWCVALGDLREFPVAVRRRLLRRVLEMLRETPLGLSWRQFEVLEKVLSSANPHAEALLSGCWAGRDYDQLWLFKKRPDFPKPFSLTVPGPGEVVIPGVGKLVILETEKPQGEDRWNVEFAADEVAFPLTIRSYRAGDRFLPAGMKGSKKVKELFIDLKLAFHQRHRVPLVLTDAILWVAGLRRSTLYSPEAKTARILRLTFTPEPASANLSL